MTTLDRLHTPRPRWSRWGLRTFGGTSAAAVRHRHARVTVVDIFGCGASRYQPRCDARPCAQATHGRAAPIGCLGGVRTLARNLSKELRTKTRRGCRRSGGGAKEHRRCRVRLPGFITDTDVGLGDAITHVPYASGITPCGSCERHAPPP